MRNFGLKYPVRYLITQVLLSAWLIVVFKGQVMAVDTVPEVVGDLVMEEVNAVIWVEVPHTGEADLDEDLMIQLPEAPKPPVLALAVLGAYRIPETNLEPLFARYGEVYGISADKLKVIAFCESGYNPAAVSSSGAYGGLYQFVASTWVSNRQAMGLDPNPVLRYDAEEAVKTAAFKMSRNGYGAWPVCGKR